MKKAMLIAAIAALAMGASLWGQTINVTSPGAGDEWCQGSTHTITWTSSGVSGAVSIKLRQGGEGSPPILDIAASTANDGSFSWTVPASMAPGNYVVRVRTVSTDPIIYGDSGTFAVTVCPASGSINVTAPTASDKWEQETSHVITWTSPGVSGPMSIKLRQAGAPGAPAVDDIVASTADDGSYTWFIPASVPSGSYVVRVRTVAADPIIYGDSADFYIGKLIVFPHDWWKKKYMEVRWPIDPDPPCLCPEWNIRELLERIKEIDPRFVGHLGLMKNGVKIMDLGSIGRGKALGHTLKPQLSRKNFAAFKNGTARFSMGLFNRQGKLMQEIQLQGEQQLR